MKRFPILCVFMASFATNAFAAGADMSYLACPGNAGATADAGTLDCAGGQLVPLLMTFEPVEASSDFIGIDAVFIINQVDPTSANFWDFMGVNAASLSTNLLRPASGCVSFLNTFPPGSTSSWSIALVQAQYNTMRLEVVARRPTALTIVANQRLFGMQLLIATTQSIEAGGALDGCTAPACIAVTSVIPRTISGNDGTALTGPSLLGDSVVINGGVSEGSCGGLPARRNTWGQLKSLYR